MKGFSVYITPEEYDSIRPQREEKNKGILFVTSGLGTVVFFALFILSFSSKT